MRLFMGVLVLTILPFAAVAGEGRYQGVSGASGVYVIDTKTGKVIKYCRATGCVAIKDNVKQKPYYLIGRDGVVDISDLKSEGRMSVRVQVPPLVASLDENLVGRQAHNLKVVGSPQQNLALSFNWVF